MVIWMRSSDGSIVIVLNRPSDDCRDNCHTNCTHNIQVRLDAINSYQKDTKQVRPEISSWLTSTRFVIR